MELEAEVGEDFGHGPRASAEREPDAEVVNRDGEDVTQGQPAASSGKAKTKANAKGKAKAKASAGQGAGKPQIRRVSKSEESIAEAQAMGVQTDSKDAWRKCGTCDQFLLATCFHDQMSKCKFCFNDKRAFDRLVALSPEYKRVQELQKNHPSEYKQMFKAFIKEREQREHAKAHISWSVTQYLEEYRSSTGSRIEHVGEFMWEGEYMAWAQTAKAGHLSETDRKANWKKWEKDLTVPRDNDGPENSVRLWVRTADQMTRFGEIAKSKSLQRTEKMNKNVSVEDWRCKLATVFSDDLPKGNGLADVQGPDFINFSAVHDRAAKVMTGNGTSSVFDGCLLDPDPEDMMKQVHAKKREFPQITDRPRKARKADIDIDVEETDDNHVAPKKRRIAEDGGKVKVAKRNNFEKGSNQTVKKSCDTKPPIFSFDCGENEEETMHGRVGATYEKDWGYREPFVLWNNERLRRFMEKPEVKTAATEFVDMFATSPCRATGAHVQLPNDLGRDFALELEPLLMNHEISVDVAGCAKTLDGCVEWDDLDKVTCPTFFGMAAGGFSVRCESNGLACYRVNMMGLRIVVMADSQAVVAFMKAIATQLPAEPTVADAATWLTTASHDDLRDFRKHGHRLYMAACRTGDLLYTPAGYVYGECMGVYDDVLGIRIGAVSLGDEIPLGLFQDCYAKHGQASKALRQALVFLELRKKVSPPSDDTAGQVHEEKSDVATASREDKSDVAAASWEDSRSRAN